MTKKEREDNKKSIDWDSWSYKKRDTWKHNTRNGNPEDIEYMKKWSKQYDQKIAFKKEKMEQGEEEANEQRSYWQPPENETTDQRSNQTTQEHLIFGRPEEITFPVKEEPPPSNKP
jgi:hypothetical protein